MRLILILAVDKNGCIGRKNTLPWRLSNDLKHFKNVTMNTPIIMGANTYKSLPGILPGREHIILSSSMESDESEDIWTFTEIHEIMSYLKENETETAFLIGGADTVKQFAELKLIDEYYLTHVDVVIEDGDTFIDLDDDLELSKWEFYNEEVFLQDDKNIYNYKIRYYIKPNKRFYE